MGALPLQEGHATRSTRCACSCILLGLHHVSDAASAITIFLLLLLLPLLLLPGFLYRFCGRSNGIAGLLAVYAAVRYAVNPVNGQLVTSSRDYVGEGLAVKVLGGLGVSLDPGNMQAGELVLCVHKLYSWSSAVFGLRACDSAVGLSGCSVVGSFAFMGSWLHQVGTMLEKAWL
jgi:hypothetical protein